MQMAYAWYPAPDRLELRYVASPAGAAPFMRLALRRQRADSEPRRRQPAAELVRARNHRSVRSDALTIIRNRIAWSCTRASTLGKPPFDPSYPPDRPLHISCNQASHAGDRRRGGRRAAPALRPGARGRGRIRRSSSSSTSAKRSCIIIRSCSSSIAAWRSASRALEPQRGRGAGRARLGVGSVAHALAYCQAVEAASQCAVRRARNSCGCCWPRWSAFTTTCTISAISATRRRSRSARQKASCSKSGPSS